MRLLSRQSGRSARDRKRPGLQGLAKVTAPASQVLKAAARHVWRWPPHHGNRRFMLGSPHLHEPLLVRRPLLRIFATSQLAFVFHHLPDIFPLTLRLRDAACLRNKRGHISLIGVESYLMRRR